MVKANSGEPGALDSFFRPKSIAVIGASTDENKIGGRPIRYLKLAGYPGKIFPINPGNDLVQGYKAYPNLQAVEESVDLVIIAVPASMVLDAMQSCVAKRVKGAIIFSAGFAETDAAGQDLQDRIVALAAAGGVRLLGPNCMGVINAAEGVLATFTSGIVDKVPTTGNISLISQSGAIGIHCYVLANERGLGLNICATTGNQSDVDVAECLAYLANDPQTDVIICCVEGVKQPELMIEAFETARRNKKPVIMMKLGRSEIGALAAASHTASLAGSDEIFDAILRQYHVCRADSIDELLDIAYACSQKRFPVNADVGLITVSGGVGIIMADAVAAYGLQAPALPEQTQQKLKEHLPFASTRNPIDVTAQIITQPQLLGPMFDALLSDGGYGSALVFFSHLAKNRPIFEKLRPALEMVARKYQDRTLVLSVLAPPDVRSDLESLGYLVFEDPRRATRAIAALVSYRQAFEIVRSNERLPLPKHALSVRRGATYSESEAKRMLESAGIPVVPERVVSSAESAVIAASEIGFPVVMKVVSKDILHKSEIGGVLLDVADDGAVRRGFHTLVERAASRAPEAALEGIQISPMIKGGVETILGVSRDPVFGPIVMFGLGGIFVEVFKDTTFRLAPFGKDEARAMIDEVRGKALLRGARGAQLADEEALEDALVRLSIYAEANSDTVESIDINPFLILPKGKGAVAVDALIIARN